MAKQHLASKACFIQHQIADRIDVHYYNPKYYQVMSDLSRIYNSDKTLSLCTLEDLLLKGKQGITGGHTPRGALYINDGVPFLRVQNVRENRLIIDNVAFINTQTHESSLARSQLKTNDILLTITGSYGISAVVLPEHLPANINQHVARLRVDTSKIDPRYLTLFLNSQLAKIQMDRLCTGSTRSSLTYPAIKQITVLFPIELQKQTRIVDKIQAVQSVGFTKIQESDRQKEMYDQIVLSELDLQIPDNPTPKYFVVERIDDRLEVKWYYERYLKILDILKEKNAIMLNDIKPTLTFGTSARSDRYGTIPCLQTNMTTRFGIDLQNIRFISDEQYGDIITNMRLKTDDLLITRSGTVGICTHVAPELEDYTYGSYMIRLRMRDKDRQTLIPQYLCIYLNSILGRVQFEKLKTGSSQYNINSGQIKQIKIIIPNIQTQHSIITKITSLLENVNNLRVEGEEILDDARKQFISHVQHASLVSNQK